MAVVLDNGRIEVDSDDDLEDAQVVLICQALRCERRGDPESARKLEECAQRISETWRACKSGDYHPGSTMAQ